MKTRSASAGTFTVVSMLALALVLSACGSDTPSVPTPPPANGTLAGTATDGGGAVAGATVMVTPSAGGTTLTLVTDGSGDYTTDVAPGSYNVLAYKDVLYEDFTAAAVAVVSSATTTQDIAFVDGVQYVGSAACIGCHTATHPDIIAAQAVSGHPFKLNKIMGATAPIYPWSDISAAVPSGLGDDGVGVDDTNGTMTDNTLGTPLSWADITYTIGGFGWKARQIDAAGYIVTGTAVQYNYWDGLAFDYLGGGGTFSSYHNNETDKPFNCGNCHTTGWRHYDAVFNPARQDGLAGMDGTFAEPGIRCEACHGAGSAHAAGPTAFNITKIAVPRTTAQLQHHSAGYGLPVYCSECHTRDGERDYPTYMSAANTAGWTGDPNWKGGAPVGGRIAVSGDFIRHHEQYDELLGIDPDTMLSTRNAAFAATHGNCGSCHDQHATTRFQDISGTDPGIRQDCTTTGCHTDSKYTNITHLTNPDVDRPDHCIDCHMPLLSKSALATYPGAGLRPPEGDVRSHIFRIDLSRDPANQFTASGSFAYPEITGRHACNRCHDSTNGVAFSLTFPNAMTIHGP